MGVPLYSWNGIFARAGGGGIGARGDQLRPGLERNERGEIDTRIVQPRDEFFQQLAALGERALAQILLALGKQIISAQMRWKFRQQFRVDGFAVEPLLQDVERLHASVTHDQKLAVDRTFELQRLA